MKCVLVMVFVGFLVAVSAFPSAVEVEAESQLLAQENSFNEDDFVAVNSYDDSDLAGVRQKRATCDLLSFSTKFGSLNHSACAAHCLVLNRGFRGGRCRDGVCHCRK